MVSDEVFAERIALLKGYDQQGGLGKEMMDLANWLFEEARGDPKRNEAIQIIAQSLYRPSSTNFKVGLILYGVRPNSLPTERETADEWNSEEGTAVVVKKPDGSYLVLE